METGTKKTRKVVVSGGFDPVHIGHVRMFEEAKKLGDRLIVILNNDNWVKDKKGYVFMPESERAEIIRAFACVDEVYITQHTPGDVDRSVQRAIRHIQPDVFANGGDRKEGTLPTLEEVVCKEYDIEMVYGVGGGKIQSSSTLVDNAKNMERVNHTSLGSISTQKGYELMSGGETRPWGSFNNLAKGGRWHVKIIQVEAGKRLSLQKHAKRDECMQLLDGDATLEWSCDESGKCIHTEMQAKANYIINVGNIHRLSSKNGCRVLETAYGDFDESDIVRIEDDYGRVS